MFLEPFRGTAPCLTCDGSGKRSIKLDPTDGTTLDDFTQVVIPPVFYNKIDRELLVREYLGVPPPLEPDNGQD